MGDSATTSQKVSCVSGQIQFDKYASKDCSGTATTSKVPANICGLGSKFEGCESTTPTNPTTTKSSTTTSTTTASTTSTSNTTAFTLFGTIITVFITSLF